MIDKKDENNDKDVKKILASLSEEQKTKLSNIAFGGRSRFDYAYLCETHKDVVTESFDLIIKNKSERSHISVYKDHAMKLINIFRNILNEYNYDYEEVQNMDKKCISFVFTKGGRIDHIWRYDEIEEDYLKVKKASYNVL